MGRAEIEELGLDYERVSAAVDFFRSYGRTTELELALAREGSDRAEADASRRSEEEWVLEADAATAYRTAAQWSLLLDLPGAQDLLGRAGALFLDLGHGFGAYLRQISHNDVPGAERLLAFLEYSTLPGRAGRRDNLPSPRPMAYAQQQVYLLLALVADEDFASGNDKRLHQIIEYSPTAFGVAPVGPLNVPVRRYWQYASALLNGDENRVFNWLQFLGARYAQNAELAQANEYLWRNAASPFEVVDLDLVGMVSLAVQRLGEDGVEALGRLEVPRVARPLIQLGQDLGRGGVSYERGGA